MCRKVVGQEILLFHWRLFWFFFEQATGVAEGLPRSRLGFGGTTMRVPEINY